MNVILYLSLLFITACGNNTHSEETITPEIPTVNPGAPQDTTYSNYIPKGYSLVWQDEFNETGSGGKNTMPNMNNWYYE